MNNFQRIALWQINISSKIANFVIDLFRKIFFKRYFKPLRILVFRTGSIGDSICAMPAMVNIRKNFSYSTIHLLSNSGKSSISLISIEKLIGPNVFEKIINYEALGYRQLIRVLSKEKYDLIIQLPQYDATLFTQLRDMFFFRFLVGIKNGFGWRYSRKPFFKKTQEKYGDNINERTRLNQILAENRLIVNEIHEFPFQITESDLETVTIQWEKVSKKPVDVPTLAIVIGAKRPQNRWPLPYFEMVVQHFSKFYNIIFIGGSEDIANAKKLLYIPNTHSFCGTMTPIQSGLMMRNCQLVLTNDTGPMHLAYAFGTPVLALFSCRDFPVRWYPPQDKRNVVLRSENIPCSICFSETCTNNICMKKIHPEEVIQQIDLMLKSKKYDIERL